MSGASRGPAPSRRPGAPEKLRPLHLPSPVRVRTDDEGRPVAVATSEHPEPGPRSVAGDGSPWQRVVQIREIWRIDDEWWRRPLSRLYFEVVLENGARIVLYRELTEGGWYR